MMTLSIAFSPCPNDTFIFGAWINQLIDAPPAEAILADVQHLNEWTYERRYPVSKVSFNCLGKILDDYVLLPSGAALGHGCGPMVIGKEALAPEAVAGRKIAIPGRDTTAYLLLCILLGEPLHPHFCTYDEVIPLMQSGEVDCGLIIHETRFTYQALGFQRIIDLGTEWEQRFGVAIPLGGIVAKRDLGSAMHATLTDAIARSLQYAKSNPEALYDYIAAHSQEKEPAVIQQHVDLYVNGETHQLSEAGATAVDTLLREGRNHGLLPQSSQPWLADVPTASLC